MSAEPECRPCICATLLLALDGQLSEPVCLCGEALTVTRLRPPVWFIQHGPNPEHRSPDYEGISLLAACDWIDSVCLEARDA